MTFVRVHRRRATNVNTGKFSFFQEKCVQAKKSSENVRKQKKVTPTYVRGQRAPVDKLRALRLCTENGLIYWAWKNALTGKFLGARTCSSCSCSGAACVRTIRAAT